MKEMICKLSGKKLEIKVFEAGFFERISGLMFKRNFDYGLLINNTNSIHTFFMFEVMDAISLDSKNTVVEIRDNMKPWGVTFFNWKARKVLELPAGWGDKLGILKGSQLEFHYV